MLHVYAPNASHLAFVEMCRRFAPLTFPRDLLKEASEFAQVSSLPTRRLPSVTYMPSHSILLGKRFVSQALPLYR